MDRGLAGLRGICGQLTELAADLDGPAEVIICYEPEVIAEECLRSIVDVAAAPAKWPCPVLLYKVPSTANYYEKKNIGARHAQNQVLIFFDTDLLPDPGWLEGMLTPFQRWEVSVLMGATYLDSVRPYDMAVALFWIFKPARAAAPLHPTISLLSNNLAMRRPLFIRFPFPDRDLYRGQCTELGIQLLNAGLTLYEQTGARARHPPPPGKKFIKRALLAGQNEHFYHALERKTSFATNWAQLRTDYRNVAKRIRERSVVLKPNASARTLAWILGSSYYVIKALGYFRARMKAQLHRSLARAEG
ncbi:glycosyltransferase family 2 protein [Terriglobus saanensis]|uniref:Glycosyl transferase family 2 n=1 Tax=Terriglobus saanensis (strain ATCC BAA-1853 / DSM 23119 / SP1PR4) TaxID=401053 RepID=E8UZV4_TERSS|nr:glycosyltransferase family 2 protein [Terriglobus saanensis]ADV81031.1 glycosyl transferase family 2 [Terriglobus saanensis SP1PR4]